MAATSIGLRLYFYEVTISISYTENFHLKFYHRKLDEEVDQNVFIFFHIVCFLLVLFVKILAAVKYNLNCLCHVVFWCHMAHCFCGLKEVYKLLTK